MASSKKPSRRQPSAPAKKPTPVDPNLARLEKLVRILERSSLSELEYEDKDIVVRLSRGGGASVAAPAPVAVAHPVASAPAEPASAPEPAARPADDAGMHVIKSPFVGTFYTAPSPDDPPFCEIGADVTKGQTLCIVEAMKLMNEIESDVAGTVAEVLAENGKAVQFGEPLFRIQKK